MESAQCSTYICNCTIRLCKTILIRNFQSDSFVSFGLRYANSYHIAITITQLKLIQFSGVDLGSGKIDGVIAIVLAVFSSNTQSERAALGVHIIQSMSCCSPAVCSNILSRNRYCCFRVGGYLHSAGMLTRLQLCIALVKVMGLINNNIDRG